MDLVRHNNYVADSGMDHDKNSANTMNHDKALAHHIRELALEYGDIEFHLSPEKEPLDFSLKDFEYDELIKTTEDGDPVFVATFTGTGTWQEKTLRARRNPPGKAHPAEYETHEEPLYASLRFYPFGSKYEGEVRHL